MAQTIGEQLKQARTQRGLTLLQASQATHIRVHFLEALENDQRDALPSTVQGRGFLRLYADHLGLPIAPLLAQWDGKPLPEPVQPEPQPETVESETVSTAATDQPTGEPGPSPAQPAPVLPPVDAWSAPVQETHADLPPTFERSQPESQVEAAPGSSAAIFQEIGQILQKQREGLGLSRAEVERYTHLRQAYVQALEEGRLDHLPSPVQGRGMLSNYAEFLNLDEDKLLLRFADGLQARRIERLPKPEPQPIFPGKKQSRHSARQPARQAPFWRRFLTPDLIFGVGVAAIILFFILWTAARITSQPAAQKQPTPPPIADILLTPVVDQSGTPLVNLTPGMTAVAGEAASGQPGTGTPGAGTPAPEGTSPVTAPGEGAPGGPAGGPDAGEAVSSAQQTLESPQQTPVQGGTPTILPINGDPLQVYIVARQRAWLRVVADDKIRFLGRTVPGNAYAFSGAKRIELLTGNAAALQVFYNQTDLGILGIAGQVVGMIFSPEGIMTPTAAFTPTSTPTKPSTATPQPSPTPKASPTITPLVPTK